MFTAVQVEISDSQLNSFVQYIQISSTAVYASTVSMRATLIDCAVMHNNHKCSGNLRIVYARRASRKSFRQRNTIFSKSIVFMESRISQNFGKYDQSAFVLIHVVCKLFISTGLEFVCG